MWTEPVLLAINTSAIALNAASSPKSRQPTSECDRV